MKSTKQVPKKILVIRFSSLGDIILSFTLLRKLRRKFPEATIDFATKPEFAEAVKLCGMTNEIIQLNSGVKNFRQVIADKKYDFIIDIHNNLKSIYVSLLNSHRIVRAKKDHFRKFLLVNGKINLFSEIIPVYKKYLLVARDLLKEDDLNFETSELKFKEFVLPEKRYIVVAPSSKHFTKTYPVSKFISLINSFNETEVVLVGSESETDKSICSRIESECNEVLNYCGRLELQELVFVIMRSELVISNDSAIMHLAEALNKRVLALFGSTVKEFGFYPQLKTTKIFEQNGLACRPCTHVGLPECPVLSFACMEKTTLKKEDLKLN
jgi:ADP-heptose:LPS heptosyltransferase